MNRQIIREEIEWGGRKLIMETGKIATQADGSIMIQYGETIVLCTVVVSKQALTNVNFLPLTVQYQEKTFSVGRIPGGFFKREGKPSEREVVASRLIDRPLRPLLDENFNHDIQIICTVLSHDLENDPEVISIIGASAALSISGAPLSGCVAASRIGYSKNTKKFILNPTFENTTNGDLDLVVAGNKEGILMVEAEASELDEDVILNAIEFGFNSFKPVVEMIECLKNKINKPNINFLDRKSTIDLVSKNIYDQFGESIKASYTIHGKADRHIAIQSIKGRVWESLLGEINDESILSSAFEKVESSILRFNILNNKIRIDGRSLNEIRTINCEVSVLPRTHGSSLFTRGETQALVVTTLGTGQDEQIIDALEGEYRERFMLHYNFPPYAVNEIGRLSSPGRREVGHGRLAWKAMRPILPSKDQFPYTIRTVAEITESNGSSSMATVCGTSLSMMDAGIPIEKPVSGIAMGLIKEDDKFCILSDILGEEDYLGDMDFKVAGTIDGVTALQMDIKTTSIGLEIIRESLIQANDGRKFILNEMNKVIQTPRSSVKKNAPKMVTIKIKRDKIREVIGSGGKVIREICDTTGAKIDIQEDGTINISSSDSKSINSALSAIQSIACDPEVGSIYNGKVVKIMEFGAFVNFMSNRDGLVHISEISDKRVNRVEDILKVGDIVKVKIIGFDDRGKIKLSMKGLTTL